MASKIDREERRLQRQRGAGKRKVKNTADFDLVLPGQELLSIEPRRSGRSHKTPESEALPLQRSSRRTPASRTIGKRKRPTGDATLNLPDSAHFPNDIKHNLGTENPRLNKKPKVREEGDDGNADARDVEAQVEPEDVFNSMEVNGGALQKSTVKKRKKRKSIGQQAPRRAKAKVSPIQKQPMQKVKPEPLSSPAQGEETSRFLEVPAEDGDLAGVQIRQELAGAAEEGLRDSLVEDAETGASSNTQLGQRGVLEGRTHKVEGSNEIPLGGEMGAEPQVYSPPTSAPVFTHIGESLGNAKSGVHEDGEGGDQNAGSEADEGEAEDNNPLPARAPTAKMFSSPAKPRRKKRKSIGQQRPKRPSAGAARKTPDTLGEAPPSRALKQQQEPKPKPPSASTKKPRQAPSKPTAAAKARGSSTNTVPITIYRPTAQHDAEASTSVSNSDHDPLMAPLPPPPDTLNAIDVLSQLTRELIAKTASNTKLSSRARKTMQLYGEELDSRMKQLGQALATNVALGQRVRVANAEERRTRGEVGGLKSEREGVRERIEEARGLKRGMRVEVLLGGVAEWVQRGWAREGAAEGLT